METASADNKVIMISFGAKWCLPCREMKKNVFPNPDDGGRPPYEIYKLAITSKKFKEVESVKSLKILQRVS